MITNTQLDGIALVVGVSTLPQAPKQLPFPTLPPGPHPHTQGYRHRTLIFYKQSGRGIGQQAAFSLAEAGAKVVVFADINEETAKESAEESKQYASNKDYTAATFTVNVSDPKGVQEMVDVVVERFGRLDYCVNGAGVGFLLTYSLLWDLYPTYLSMS